MSIQSEIDRIEQNIADTYSVLAEAGAPMPASMDSDNLAGTTATISAVLYNKNQNLSDAQKSQGRANIGAIDETYANTNFATKSEYNSLKETVDALAPSEETEVETVFSYSYETAQGTGYLFFSDGVPQTGITPYKYTMPIPVNADSIVEYKIKGTSGIAVVAFFDKNNAYVSGIAGTGSTVESTTQVPENAAYVIFSFSASGQYGLVRNVANGEIVETLTRYYNIGGTPESDTDVVADPSGFYNLSGEFLSTSGYNYVPKFKVTGTVVGFLSYDTAKRTTVARIAFYDEYERFISAIAHDQTSGDKLFIAPEGTAYIALSFVEGKTASYTLIAQYEIKKTANIDGLQEWLEQAKQSLNPLYGKKLVATGDSITQGGSLPNGSYATMIASENNMTFQNKAIWGAIFATGITDSNGRTLDSIYTTIAQMDADADYVIISGGVNDFSYMHLGNEPLGEISIYYEGVNYNTGTYCGALEQICKDSLVKWAGKKVLFVIEHRMNGMQQENVEGSYDYNVKNVYMPLLIQILEKWGMPYVDLYTSMPTLANINYLKENFTIGDGWHPNEEGYKDYYIPPIISKMKAI